MKPIVDQPGWSHETALELFVWSLSVLRVAGAVLANEAGGFEVNVAFAVAIGTTWLLARVAWRRLVRAAATRASLPPNAHPYRGTTWPTAR